MDLQDPSGDQKDQVKPVPSAKDVRVAQAYHLVMVEFTGMAKDPVRIQK